MEEDPSAKFERARIRLASPPVNPSPLFTHILHGLAYTQGSAIGSIPPSVATCLAAFMAPNKAGLTAGARAWSKHSHRSEKTEEEGDNERKKASSGWWGMPSGPVPTINEAALTLFWKVVNGATWRNLHWLPHQVLVYEARVPEGYGMRWSQDQSVDKDTTAIEEHLWTFRGFVEPMMENGHEVGWKH